MTKAVDAFRTISEVAELLDTPTHVLRFWESRFPQIKPLKRAGGRRYYRPGDVALLGGIKVLLHTEGMTIRGVQKVLREQGIATVSALSPVILAPLPTGGSQQIDLTAEDGPTTQSAIARVLPFPKSDPLLIAPSAPTGPADAEGPDDIPEAPMAVNVPVEDPSAEIMAFTPAAARHAPPTPTPPIPTAPVPAAPAAASIAAGDGPADPLWSAAVIRTLTHLDTAALSTVERVRLLALNDRLLRLRARLAAAPSPSRH